ncbi:MAG: hypothetical protein AABX38_05375 [Candidatus Micrarchaeota archaeon]
MKVKNAKTSKNKPINIKKMTLIFLLGIFALVFFYVFVPSELNFIKEFIVWALFIWITIILAFTGIYLIKKYNKEDKGRLQRLMENITAGIVGALLVTMLDKFKIYSFALSSFSLNGILEFLVSIFYVFGILLFTLGASLLPIWAILSYLEKDDG